MDVALIAAAQKVEHYEIAAYGTVCTYAEMLGYDQVHELLGQNLDEEETTDQKLTALAETAIQQHGDDLALETWARSARRETGGHARRVGGALRTGRRLQGRRARLPCRSRQMADPLLRQLCESYADQRAEFRRELGGELARLGRRAGRERAGGPGQ